MATRLSGNSLDANYRLSRLALFPSATSDQFGNITYTIGPVPMGYVWEGTFSDPNGPVNAIYEAKILGTHINSWVGMTSSGMLQLWGQETLTIDGIGLGATINYQGQFSGVCIPEPLAVPKPVAQPSNSVTTVIPANGQPIEAFVVPVSPQVTTFPFKTVSNWQSILVALDATHSNHNTKVQLFWQQNPNTPAVACDNCMVTTGNHAGYIIPVRAPILVLVTVTENGTTFLEYTQVQIFGLSHDIMTIQSFNAGSSNNTFLWNFYNAPVGNIYKINRDYVGLVSYSFSGGSVTINAYDENMNFEGIVFAGTGNGSFWLPHYIHQAVINTANVTGSVVPHD